MVGPNVSCRLGTWLELGGEFLQSTERLAQEGKIADASIDSNKGWIGVNGATNLAQRDAFLHGEHPLRKNLTSVRTDDMDA